MEEGMSLLGGAHCTLLSIFPFTTHIYMNISICSILYRHSATQDTWLSHTSYLHWGREGQFSYLHKPLQSQHGTPDRYLQIEMGLWADRKQTYDLLWARLQMGRSCHLHDLGWYNLPVC